MDQSRPRQSQDVRLRERIVRLADTPKERIRVLRLLTKKTARLKLPLGNAALEAMVNEGLVRIDDTFVSRWNGRSHEMAMLCISASGKTWLSKNSDPAKGSANN